MIKAKVMKKLEPKAPEPKFKIGQTLFFVPDAGRYRDCQNVKIKSISTKWIKLDNGMYVDINTLQMDKETSPDGRCYMSEGDYLKECDLRDEWELFRTLIPRIMPSEMSLLVIEKAKELLKIKAG